MESSHHQFLKPFLPADDHRFQFELYTIPATSGWFSWDNINEIEKTSLKEFFDGSSFTRNPRVYKEYRDFIISKYREDPSRRLTFSEVRKSLVGDVNYLLKVFLFLEKWGLINFGLQSPSSVKGGNDCDLVVREDEEEGKWKVKVEDGPPHGVRVVAIPNSLKPVLLPASVISNNDSRLAESDFKMPPLSSYSDVYQELIELICGNCKERCESGHYEHTKGEISIICIKCFKNGSYGKNKSVDDYKFVESTVDEKGVAAWTEAEMLLLLESVLKHGDDWDLVAQNVQTKTKLECISKLIQLPFGQLMLGSTYDKCRYRDTNNITNNQKQGQGGPPAPQEAKEIRIQHVEPESENQLNGDADSEGPPAKRLCIAPISDTSNPKMEQADTEDEQIAQPLVVSEEIKEKENQLCELENQSQPDGDLAGHCPPKINASKPIPDVRNLLMHQIARISAVVGPNVAASAAEAAVTALCDENEIPKEIFDVEENGNELRSTTETNDLEMDARHNESGADEGVIPLPLRIIATSATALGAAAAHAKLLAVQEDREIEHLVSTVINAQLKKLQHKMELLKELEVMMEKEYNVMAEVEEALVMERMDVVQKVIDAGISRWGDHKSQVEIITLN